MARAGTAFPRVFLLALGYCLVCGCLFLSRSGLHNDEGIRGIRALEYLSNLHQFPHGHWRLMENSYIGTATAFLSLPFVALLGPTPAAIRLPYVLLALASLLLVRATLRRVFDPATATVTACLLAVNSTFIQAARVGGFREEILQISLFWSVLGLVVIPRRPALVAAAFVAGLALWAKLMFLGYLAGLAVAVVFFPLPWKRAVGSVHPFRAAAAGAAFLAGLSPLICWNVANGWPTPIQLLAAFHRPPSARDLCDNTHFAVSLWERCGHLLTLLTSRLPSWNLDGCSPLLVNWAYCALAAAAAAGVLGYCLRQAAEVWTRRKLGFFAVLYGVLFLCTCFSPVARAPGHLIILFPFPEMLIAFFLCRVLPPVCWLRAAFGLLLVLHVATEAAIMARMLDHTRSGRIDFALDPGQKTVAQALRRHRVGTLLALHDQWIWNVGYLAGNAFPVIPIWSDVPPPVPSPGEGEMSGPLWILLKEGDGAEPSGWLEALRTRGWRPEFVESFTAGENVSKLYHLHAPAPRE